MLLKLYYRKIILKLFLTHLKIATDSSNFKIDDK